MPKFTFTGNYESNVGLPDGSVRLTQPGETVALDFNDPGPLWAPVKSAAARTPVPEPTPEPADVAAWLATHPKEIQS